MNQTDDTELLYRLLKNYCHVEDREGISALRKNFSSSKAWEQKKETFKFSLAKAIHNHTFSCESFEELTGYDFYSEQELYDWLSQELWPELFECSLKETLETDQPK